MKNNLISALAMGLLALSSCSVQTELPVYMDESRDIDERVADALSRMTMEEKVAILHAQSKFSHLEYNVLESPNSGAPTGLTASVRK